MRWQWVFTVIASALLLTLVTGQDSVVRAADGSGYSYNDPAKCKKCHFKQYNSWKKTSMANAFDSLYPGEAADAKVKAGLDPEKDYSADPDCLRCHTTGYGQPGGFVSIDETPEMAGISCDACHGPSSGYLEIKTVEYKDHPIKEMTDRGMIYPSTETQCLTCHGGESPFNGELDAKYAFHFDERIQLDEGSHEHLPLKGDHPDIKSVGSRFQN